MAGVFHVTPEDVQWSRNLFNSMNDGATWGVPRSGLVFKREGGKLVLRKRMPYTPEVSAAFGHGADVPPSQSAMDEYQQRDFELIAAHFRAAGIEVEDETCNVADKEENEERG